MSTVTIKRRADIHGLRGYVVRVDGVVVGYAVMRRHYHYEFRPVSAYRGLLYQVHARRIKDLRVRIEMMWHEVRSRRYEPEPEPEEKPYYPDGVPERVRRVLYALHMKTEARGATVGEAEAARAKIVELRTKYGVAA